MHKNKRRLKITVGVLKKQPNIKKSNSFDGNFVAMSTDQCALQSICGRLSGRPRPWANEGIHLRIPSPGWDGSVL